MQQSSPTSILTDLIAAFVKRAVTTSPVPFRNAGPTAKERNDIPIYRDGDCRPDDPHTLSDRMRR